MTLEQEPQELVLDCKGLFTMPNALSKAPLGSLLTATNIVSDYDGLVSGRRGISQYGTELVSSTPDLTDVYEIFQYQDTLLIWWGVNAANDYGPDEHYLSYDSDGAGTWVQTSYGFPRAAYTPTDTYRFAEGNGNFYITSINGILKLDNVATALYSAGGLPGLDGTGSLTGASGFLPANSAVAYRMIWNFTDANNNLISGTPSTRLVITNDTGVVIDSNSGATIEIASIASSTFYLVGQAQGGNGTTGLTIGNTITQGSASTTISTIGLAFTISSVSAAPEFTVSSTSGITVGDTIVQSANFTTVASIQDATHLTVTSASGFTATTAYDISIPQITVASASGFAAGQTSNVSLTYTIPNAATTAYQYQIYRTQYSIAATADPGDSEQLIITGNIDSTDLTNRYFTVTDSVPQADLGAYLYTNANQATNPGENSPNNIPPVSWDMAFYKQYMIYGGNVTTQQTFLFSLLATGSPDGIQSGDTFTVTNGVDTFTLTGGSSENVSTGTFKVFTSATAAENIVLTKASFIKILNRYASNNLVYAFDASDVASVTSLPGDMYLQEQAIGGGQYTINSSRATCWTPALQPQVAFTVTTVTDGTHLVVSSTTGITAGDNIVQNTYITQVETVTSGTQLVVVSTAGWVGSATAAYDADSVTDSYSTQSGQKNQVFVSKYSQSEAVPLTNTISIGSPNYQILRVRPLRNSVIIFKEDGLYSLTGETFPFVVTTLDNSIILTVPESPAILNNQVFCYTNQGVVAVTETGPGIISRPIENQLQFLSSYNFSGFDTVTRGTAYNTDRKYILSTVLTTNDIQTPQQAFVYNTITETWTVYQYPINYWDIQEFIKDGRLYVASSPSSTAAIPANTLHYVYQERKAFNSSDGADILLPITITAFNGTEITVSDTSSVTVGWSLAQLTIFSDSNPITVIRTSVITEILDGTHLIVADDNIGWVTGTGPTFVTVVAQPISIDLLYTPIHCNTANIIKFWYEIQGFFQNINFANITFNFSSDIQPVVTPVILTPENLTVGWGAFPWGSIPWGGNIYNAQAIRTYIPQQVKRARWLNIELIQEEAFTTFTFGGFGITYRPITTRTH